MAGATVDGFLPSTCGFRFANQFPPGPLFHVGPRFCRLPVGDASRGLCGGMIYTACDLFAEGERPPPGEEPPARDQPLFGRFVRRLFDSFDLPHGPLKYYAWMAAREDGPATTLLHRTLHREWPRVKRCLDGGQLATLGLVRVRTFNPLRMGENHQVLAYGYRIDEEAGELTLLLYDPNYPCCDDVTLTADLAGRRPLVASTGEPVRGFFFTPYRSRGPRPGR